MLSRSRIARVLTLAAGMLGCGLFEPKTSSVTMAVEIPATTLTTNDTLVVRRAVFNLGTKSLWLDVSVIDGGYNMVNSAGVAACFVDFPTANTTGFETLRIPPDSTAEVERRFPVANLTN